MIWPIGQPTGELRDLALASRARWLKLGERAGIAVRACGSIHLAHHDDEWEVLQEFAHLAQSENLGCECLSPDRVLQRSPAPVRAGLRGGLWSPHELGVTPRVAIPAFARWLLQQPRVQISCATPISRVTTGEVVSSSGASWQADRIVICSGADLSTLFPEVLAESSLRLCKLQMMKTVSQPQGWQLGTHIASGLTLRHYRNFERCPSLKRVQERIAREQPELDRYGIHVMAAQNSRGELILGDSHEYDADIADFDRVEIDELILQELRKIVQIPDWSLSERWHGYYLKHPSQAWFEAEPLPRVHLLTGLGGAGMTLSLGLAERCWNAWDAASST